MVERPVDTGADTTAEAPNAPTVCTNGVGTIAVSAVEIGANADGATRALRSSRRPATTAANVDTGAQSGPTKKNGREEIGGAGGAGISAPEEGLGAERAEAPETEREAEGSGGAPEEKEDDPTPGPAGPAGRDAPVAVVGSPPRAVGAARRWAPLVSRVGGGVGMRERGVIDVFECTGWEGWSKDQRQSAERDWDSLTLILLTAPSTQKGDRDSVQN